MIIFHNCVLVHLLISRATNHRNRSNYKLQSLKKMHHFMTVVYKRPVECCVGFLILTIKGDNDDNFSRLCICTSTYWYNDQ